MHAFPHASQAAQHGALALACQPMSPSLALHGLPLSWGSQQHCGLLREGHKGIRFPFMLPLTPVTNKKQKGKKNTRKKNTTILNIHYKENHFIFPFSKNFLIYTKLPPWKTWYAVPACCLREITLCMFLSGKWARCTLKYYLVPSNYIKIYTKIFASSKTNPTWNPAYRCNLGTVNL